MKKKRPEFIVKLWPYVVLGYAFLFLYYLDDFKLFLLLLNRSFNFSFPIEWFPILVSVGLLIIGFSGNRLQYKQFKQSQEEFRVKNYYKHKDVFIKHVENAIASLRNSRGNRIDNLEELCLSKYQIGLLFDKWFETENISSVKIKDCIMRKVNKLYGCLLKEHENTDWRQEYESLLNDLGLKKLGFDNNIKNDHNRKILTIATCKAISEFTSQHFENEDKLYYVDHCLIFSR